MANPTLYAGYKAGIYLVTLTSPATATFICGIEISEIDFERGVLEANVRDCASPLAAPTTVRLPGNKSCTISGSGKLSDDSEDEIFEWLDGNVARSVEFRISAGPKFSGSFVCTKFTINAPADGNGFIDVSLTAVSSGAVSRTASWS